MQAEEIGKLCLSDSKVLESVAGLSEYQMRQKVEGVPEQQVFTGCRFCGGKSWHSKDKCLANENKCHDCGFVRHFKRQCNFIKKSRRQRGLQIIKKKHTQLMQCKIEWPWGATAKGQSRKLGYMAFLYT